MKRTDNMRKTVVALLALMLVFSSCEDDYTSQYSTKYPVRFYYVVNTAAELINTIGCPGEYATIRRSTKNPGYISIANSLGGHDYALSYVGGTDFLYGLGGLIVGTCNMPNMSDGYDIVAYDLACPTCDRPEYRLSLKGDGTAKCSHCGLTYDMNNLGVIISADKDSVNNARGLYRYRITYDGYAIRVSN